MTSGKKSLAFKMSHSITRTALLTVEVISAKGYCLYKDKICFALKNCGGVVIDAIRMPAGEAKGDRHFGKTDVFRKPVPVQIALTRTPEKNLTLVASARGYHEKECVC